jgi:hypothetical protein
MDWLVTSSLVGSIFLLALGCGHAPLGPEDGNGEDGSMGAEDSSEGSSTTAPLEEGPDCTPADPALSLRFDTNGVGGTCVVVAPIEGATISFECESPDGPPEIGSLFVDVEPQLPMMVAIGTELNIEVLESRVLWEQPTSRYSVYARHSQTNELVFAAIDANDLDWVGRISPVVLEPIDDACAIQPDDSNCRKAERLMWNAEHGGDVMPVGDASRSDVGDYAVHIQRAADGMLLVSRSQRG